MFLQIGSFEFVVNNILSVCEHLGEIIQVDCLVKV